MRANCIEAPFAMCPVREQQHRPWSGAFACPPSTRALKASGLLARLREAQTSIGCLKRVYEVARGRVDIEAGGENALQKSGFPQRQESQRTERAVPGEMPTCGAAALMAATKREEDASSPFERGSSSRPDDVRAGYKVSSATEGEPGTPRRPCNFCLRPSSFASLS